MAFGIDSLPVLNENEKAVLLELVFPPKKYKLPLKIRRRFEAMGLLQPGTLMLTSEGLKAMLAVNEAEAEAHRQWLLDHMVG